MAINRISDTLTDADQRYVLQTLNTLQQKLSFLIDLTPDERKGLVHLGDRNRAFVHKALEVATQNPDFLPRAFNIDELRRDLALYDALQPILMALTQLQELVDDTAVAAGGEAYDAALQVYRYAKANSSVAGLDNVIDDLSQRFAQTTTRSRVTSPETAPAT